jgi:hypothetical protein
MRNYNRPPTDNMGATQNESPAEQELTEYARQMEDALAEVVIEKARTGQPSDAKTAFRESLIISRMFDSVITDNAGVVPIDDIQKDLDQRVTTLGLNREKFSLHRIAELIQAVEK